MRLASVCTLGRSADEGARGRRRWQRVLQRIPGERWPRPVLRTTASGISVTTVRLATNDRDQPEFHDIVLWRQLAEFAARYMTKGRLAYVEGRVQARGRVN